MEKKSHIVIKNVGKVFTDSGGGSGMRALEDINLEIMEGEVVVLLGPSGCGKSTLLRIIGGLETKTEGEIYFYDQEISPIPVEKRGVGFVFQNYALFPTMTVRENIGFGLRIRKQNKADAKKRVDELLDMMDLQPYADRKPIQLSGGQQQRVAIARVLAIEPKVLLMDEPLTALDAKLKEYLRVELGILFRRLGITTIYVTHDQLEAMAIADRIAIMNKGVIDQIGSPEEVYSRPSTDFVADFIGKINSLEGRVEEQGGKKYVSLGFFQSAVEGCRGRVGDTVRLYLRPEDISLAETCTPGCVEAVVEQSTFQGSSYHIQALVDGQSIFFDSANTIKLKKDDKIFIHINTDKLIVV